MRRRHLRLSPHSSKRDLAKFRVYMDKTSRPGDGKRLSILGVPLGFGAGKTGSEMGANAMRLSAIRGKLFPDHLRDLGYDVTDEGDVEIVMPSEIAPEGTNPKYLSEMASSSANMAERVKAILDSGSTPVILGGDHSIAIGTFSGVSAHFHDKGE